MEQTKKEIKAIEEFFELQAKRTKEWYLEEIQAEKEWHDGYCKLFPDTRMTNESTEYYWNHQKELKSRLSKVNYAIIKAQGYGYDLDKMIAKAIDSKRKVLYKTIENKLGNEEIINVDLRLGNDGSVNGNIYSTDKKLNIETVYAGGYNVQCLHYRVLVRVSK